MPLARSSVMFQTPSRQTDIVMQPTLHLNTPFDKPSARLLKPDLHSPLLQTSDKMYINTQEPSIHLTYSSGASTPISTGSYSSYAPSVLASTYSAPRRSSLKSSLQSSSAGLQQSRRASPPTVRFFEPEPEPRPKATPVQQQQRPDSGKYSVPNPILRYRHRPATFASSTSLGLQPYSILPPRSVSTPRSGPLETRKSRVGQRFSSPVQPSRPDPRWSGKPLPANFTPPSVALEQRVTSFQSVASNLSVQSAPAVLQSPAALKPPGQYNPLENYIPCLYAACDGHYSSAHGGPTCYLPQGPYSLPKHHGYCPEHASKELKEANAQCKHEWERLRQGAGRKTLGEVSSDFDFFLQSFRRDRKAADAELQRRQRRRVLGATAKTHGAAQDQGTQKDLEWDWRFTPRNCTREACRSMPYSPFENHLYAFYHAPRPLFTPLPTLCPPCAKTEVEAFERYTLEKWNSRCGWDGAEWEVWVQKADGDRDCERDFWLRAQERVVRERGPAEWVEREMEEGSAGVGKEKRRGLLKRWFGAGG